MSSTITRSDLTNSIYREIGLSQTQSSELVDEVFEIIMNGVKEEDVVKISGFGTFKKRKKNARYGRNPKTKEEHLIAERYVVTFTASNVLKEQINEPV